MKVYRGTDGDVEPVEMECERFGYPNRTSTGEMMHDNTFFKTEEEAWDSILRSVRAGVYLSGSEVIHVEKMLDDARIRAGEAVKMLTLADRNYQDWKSNSGGKK